MLSYRRGRARKPGRSTDFWPPGGLETRPPSNPIAAPSLGRAAAAVAALALAGAVAAAYPSSDPDVHFHLAAGREIAETGASALSATEPFAFPAEGRPFVNHEWAFDLALWAATGGEAGPVVAFKAALAAALFAVAGLLALRLGASPAATLLAGIAAVPAVRASLEARPHLAGFLAAALLALALDAATRGRRWRVVLPSIVVAAWANLHGSFPIAFPIWAIRAAVAWRANDADPGRTPREGFLRIAATLPLLALATLANPWGAELWSVVVHHADPAYRVLVPEWGGVRWGESPAFDASFLAVAAGALLSFLPRANRGRHADLATALLFVVPAAVSVKFAAGLLVGAVPALAANVTRTANATGSAPRPRLGALLAAGAVAVAALAPLAPPHLAPGLGFDLADKPAAAIDSALANGWTGRAFHSFDVGGYVEHVAHPRIRTFIDGRAYVHGRDGLDAYLGALADYRAFRALHARWSFDLIIADLLDPSFPRLIAGLSADPGFSLAWIDSRFALFVPAGRAADPYRVLRATTDPRYLLAMPDADLHRAREEVGRVLASPAGEVMGRLARGVIALRVAGVASLDAPPPAAPEPCAAARDDFARLVELRPDVPMFRHLLAFAARCARP
ncbi:MAG: hypothetical protein FJ087_06810 [Deltaproteobacteria bacterium]|nr:hypothetical protein [Deltaproteobacteria bacterium]